MTIGSLSLISLTRTASRIGFAKMKNSVKHLNLNSDMKFVIENSVLSTGFCGLQCNLLSFEYVVTFIEHSYFETTKDTLKKQ